MIKIYPLEWLDSLILQTFNPKNTTGNIISASDLSLISENISEESNKIQVQLKNEVYSLRKKREIRLLIRKYHSTLIFLLDNVIENRNNDLFQGSGVSVIIDGIINSLDELLFFVETRFSNYLNLDERVPITYLIVARKELELKVDKIRGKKISNGIHGNVMEIVLAVLYKLVKFDRGYKITYRQILYQKELLKNLESFNDFENTLSVYSSFDVLLIGLNFNCLEYVNSLISRILSDVDNQESTAERMTKLLWHFKEFRQLYSNDKIMFEPSQQNIKEILNNWFKHEIAYLKKGMEFTQESKTDSVTKPVGGIILEENKIECILSTDQMGLILRATDESRIVKARSMSQVFKTIVPHLSTPFKKDLSYQSVRSKSYNAEERDKEIAIQTLEKIIKKIKTY
ncbi:MAG TPA: hypothetical protein VFS71_16865 [Flavobacterium sp.]|uniref:hypothetical protein n=1 Tax=Flavobacterium sp. TaxID=239 RepID=UPI002DBB7ED9|nr:hypothetical protein [Flavobacterium sp.]HEU4791362.1 hypothetical protein [Flavobacterium sp.]